MTEVFKLKTKDGLDVTIENDAIVLRKSITHKTLEQRVVETGIPLIPNDEYDFGNPVEGEYW